MLYTVIPSNTLEVRHFFFRQTSANKATDEDQEIKLL